MRIVIGVLAGALAVAACGTAPPPTPGYLQQEFAVARPAATVFADLEDRMSRCHEVNSMFGRADLAAHYDSTTGRGRLTVERAGRTLWGAELLAAGETKTRVLAYAARDVKADHYEWLIRQWAEQTYKPVQGGLFPDC